MSGLPMPERTPSDARPRRSRALWVLLLLLVLCGIGAIGAFFLTRPSPDLLPHVEILQPAHGAQVNANKPLAVLAQARSLQPLAHQELWVDGRVVYIAPAPPGNPKEFTASLLWIPQPGGHTLTVRAIDTLGNVGTSNRVPISVGQALASANAIAPAPSAVHIVRAGETLDSIARDNVVAPDDLRASNPNVSDPPPPGSWLNLPPGSEAEAQGEVDDKVGGMVADPGEEPIPDDLPSAPAEPGGGLGGDLLGGLITDPGLQPPAAPGLKVRPGANCSVSLKWLDKSNNESGFYIYRALPGALRFARIATLAANDQPQALTYLDPGVSGTLDYYVAAYNGAGEAASRIVRVEAPDANCWQELIAVPLQVEVENLYAPGQFEEVYCYAALKGHRPWERVPTSQAEYLRRLPSAAPERADFLLARWNMDEHYAGANKRVIAAPENGAPLQVEVECWGAQVTDEGGSSVSLGRFDQSHPPAEWDGRTLTGRGVSGNLGFNLEYHIQPWSGPGGEPNAAHDPDLPTPFGLRRARDAQDCAAHSPADPASLFGCALANYSDHPPLVWEWNGAPEQIDGYRIYMNRTPVGGRFEPIDEMPKDFRIWVGPSRIPCGETWRYTVSAFDAITESEQSRFFALSGDECDDHVLVEVELLTVNPTFIDDGWACTTPIVCLPGTTDSTAEAYGNARFAIIHDDTAEQNKGVNLVTSPDSLVPTFGIGPVKMNWRDPEPHYWANLPLCHFTGSFSFICDDALAGGHNKLYFIVGGDDELRGTVSLWDDDGPEAPDLWCDVEIVFPPMPLDLWDGFDESVYVDGRSTDWGRCSISARVRGMERVGRSHVLPSGGGGISVSGKQANLRVEQVTHNPQGNVRVTLFNAGPDTLVQEAAALDFQVARVESGVGGSPSTIFEHSERVLLTIPAFGETVIDTGQVLLAGMENRVRVTVNPTTFSDPDASDDSNCAIIDMPTDGNVSVRPCAGR